MSNSVKKVPVHTEAKTALRPKTAELMRPFEKLRQQVDHLFEDFSLGSGCRCSTVDCSMSPPCGTGS